MFDHVEHHSYVKRVVLEWQRLIEVYGLGREAQVATGRHVLRVSIQTSHGKTRSDQEPRELAAPTAQV
jgi:hypothetical protein